MTSPRLRLASALSTVLILASACGSDANATTAQLPTIESSTTTVQGPSDTSANEAEAANGTETSGTDTPGDEPVDPQLAFAEFDQCMADHGIEIETSVVSEGAGFDTLDDASITDPDDLEGLSSPSDFTEADFEEAQAACDPILANAFGDFELSPEQEAEFADEMLELEKCLSAQGFEIDLDDATFEVDESVDFDALNAAMTKCAPETQTVGEDQ